MCACTSAHRASTQLFFGLFSSRHFNGRIQTRPEWKRTDDGVEAKWKLARFMSRVGKLICPVRVTNFAENIEDPIFLSTNVLDMLKKLLQ